MKYFVALVVVVILSQSWLTECGKREVKPAANETPAVDQRLVEQWQAAIDKLPIELIPARFRLQRGSYDNSHWCCKVDTPLVHLERTHIVSHNVQTSENVRCGHDDCGLFGWSSCTRWCTNYRTEIRYFTEWFTVTEQTMCPEQNRICCAGFILVLDNCYTLEEIRSNMDLLNALNQSGIDIPVIGK